MNDTESILSSSVGFQLDTTRTSPTQPVQNRLGGAVCHPSQGQLSRSDAHSCTYSLGPASKGQFGLQSLMPRTRQIVAHCLRLRSRRLRLDRRR